MFVWSASSLAIGVSGDATGPTALVVRGPYRHVRHPLYIAVALAFVGVWVAYGRWRIAGISFLLIISLLAHLAVVRYEEAATRRRVGQVYDLYCARVPRWVPRVSPAEVADLTAHDEKAAEQTVATDRPKTDAG
jgi:protein-S-isoprenylcysteine O-methyltransferase Ste14